MKLAESDPLIASDDTEMIEMTRCQIISWRVNCLVRIDFRPLRTPRIPPQIRRGAEGGRGLGGRAGVRREASLLDPVIALNCLRFVRLYLSLRGV